MTMTMTKTYDVVGGRLKPDVSHLSREEAIARKAAIAARLAETRGLLQDMWVRELREQLKLEDQALADHLRELKERQKRENLRRNFAGLQSPLFDACRRFLTPATVECLEKHALAILSEREQKKVDSKK